MFGILMAILSGAAMSLQGVMNTRLSEKIGLLESNSFVQGTAFVLSLIAMLAFGKGNFSRISSVSWPYLLGGALGLFITVGVMVSIRELNATVAISIILISQILLAALIDAFGWMGSEKIPFGWQKYVAIALMISSVILFKWQTR